MAKLPFNLKSLLSAKAIGRLLLSLIAFVSLIVLCSPLWLGWALKMFLPADLVQIETYKTDGYGRFRLKEVTITHPVVSVSIQELSAPTPLNWLRYAIIGGGSEISVAMDQVGIDLTENSRDEQETPGSLPPDLPSTVQLVEKILLKTDKWLPHIVIQNARLTQSGRSLDLSSVEWNDRKLATQGVTSLYPDFPFQLALNLGLDAQSIAFEIPAVLFDLKARLQERNSKWVAAGTLTFRENTALVEATFGRESWSPDSASWNLNDWELNLNTLGLNSVYSDLSFDLQGKWEESAVANTLNGSLSTGGDATDQYLPPVDFQSDVGGNAQSLSMTRFNLAAPGINAGINESVHYNLEQMQVSGDVRLDIDFDLGILNHDDIDGQLTGLLEINTEDGKPVGQFDLNGSDIKLMSHEFDQLDIDADLNWPFLRLESVNAKLTTGSTINAQGLLDLKSRSVSEATLSGTITQETLSSLLPDAISLNSTAFEAQASGPLGSISHSGSLQLDSIETSVIKPFSAAAFWNGQNLDLESLEIAASNEANQVTITASGNLNSRQTTWRISQLELSAKNQSLGKLTAPTILQINREDGLLLSFENFQVKGGQNSISINAQVNYPDSGNLEFQAEGIETSVWIDPWIKNPLPQIEVNTFHTKANWNQGPLSFETTIDGHLTIADQLVKASGRLSSDGSDILLDNLVISDTQGPWISVNGEAPLSIHPLSNEKVQLHRNDSFGLNFSTSESQNWLDWLSGISPFQLETFSSDIQLSGSLTNLQGDYNIETVTKEGPGEHGMPSTSIHARGEIENNLLTISSMNVAVEEEKFQVTGSVELPNSIFDKIDKPTEKIDWQQTTFQLKIPPSKLTPLRYFAPQLLSNGGEIEADLKGSFSGGITGHFRIQGMNTRPIFPFGSIRDLSADLEFDNSQAKLNNISGFIGREPVTISGSLDYRNWDQPTYHFTIAGNDLPILRKPGLLLRSDLNLSIDKSSDNVTAVTGNVNLKDGLFLLNRSNLLAGDAEGGRSAATRPPYFSVESKLLSDWTLDVAVKGEQFMQVKTPAADGLLSLNMSLQGNLREPFATGRLEFDEGHLFFPFSSFTIDYGIAELPLNNPYVPVIEIIGSSRRFGYDLGVEITGTAYDPQVTFTSSPPLSSEQIMLMVMTGENPDGMFDYSTSQRASKLGAFISKGLFASDDSGGSLMSRLNLTLGENLSEQGKETMKIEFELNERFQVIGEYDEYDFWNAGLLWRIYQRQAVENEPKGAGK